MRKQAFLMLWPSADQLLDGDKVVTDVQVALLVNLKSMELKPFIF